MRRLREHVENPGTAQAVAQLRKQGVMRDVGEVFDVDLTFDDKCVESLPIVLAPLLRLGDLNQRWHWDGGAFKWYHA